MDHQWQIHRQDTVVWLRCSLLDPWPHGFFSRAGGADPILCAPYLNVPPDQAFRLKQIHSDLVFMPSELPAEGDALITDQRDHSVWAASADCVPMLIALGSWVGAVHAGWRGTAQEILPKTLRRLADQGLDLQDAKIALGPAISRSHYPVGEDVALMVLNTIGETNPQPDLDLRAINRDQALALGVRPEQIAICPYCTYENPEWFYSYRRDGRTGVQLSGIATR